MPAVGWLCLLLLGPAEAPVRFAPGPSSDPTADLAVQADLPREAYPEWKLGPVPADQAGRVLQVRLFVPETRELGPPLWGTYERRANGLWFQPRYGWSPGRTYRAVRTLPNTAPESVDYTVPQVADEPPTVVQVYPTSPELPANHLKFQLVFSAPMRPGSEIFDAVQLVDEQGIAIEDPWRRQELWSADFRLLTLWIHPGRIKRGVGLREELGPVLEPGQNYRIVITSQMKSATGRPLAKEWSRGFRAGSDDRTRPDLRAWTLSAPVPGSRDPLAISLPEIMDWTALQRMLRVQVGPREISGAWNPGPHERSVQFVPHEPWQSGEHELIADERLADLAGNTPVRLFDVDLRDPPVDPLPVRRRFSLGPATSPASSAAPASSASPASAVTRPE